MLSSPADGEVSVTGQMIGDTATYICNSGFEFLDRTPGSDVRTCQSDVTWSGDEQQCSCKRKSSFFCSPLFFYNFTALGSSVDVGPIVGGVVAVVLILAITAVTIAVIVIVRGKRTQQE